MGSSWSPDFCKIDLLALYATMYLKRIVVNSLPWEEHLDTLYDEIVCNMEKIGTEKMKYLFPTLRDFARLYSNQWSVTEYGHTTFQTLLLVLSLRLGLEKIWIPDTLYFREDILLEGFLAQKPTLKLNYISFSNPFYEHLLPLCPNLTHVSIPLSDNALFMKTVTIKFLRILEFSIGVADRVLCNSLWSLDKKSDKVLQMVIKHKEIESYGGTLALPNLEVLRSNIQNKVNGSSSMKITLGAAALVLQPKLRIVENRQFWTTVHAIEALLEMENRFKIKNQHKLAVDQLVIDPHFTAKENRKLLMDRNTAETHYFPANNKLIKILEISPCLSKIIFMDPTPDVLLAVNPLFKNKIGEKIEHFAVDVCFLSMKSFLDLLTKLGGVKHLTLRISTTLIVEFYPKKASKPFTELMMGNLLPSLESLSLVLCERKFMSKAEFEEEGRQLSTSMISFLSLFWHINGLHYYNVIHVPPYFVVYGCIGGAMAVMHTLKHLTLNGYSMFFPMNFCKATLQDKDVQVSDLLPELMADVTFKILKNLESFEIDELFLSPGVDRFLEVLRTCNVHVKVNYRAPTLRGSDPCMYIDYDDFDAFCAD